MQQCVDFGGILKHYFDIVTSGLWIFCIHLSVLNYLADILALIFYLTT